MKKKIIILIIGLFTIGFIFAQSRSDFIFRRNTQGTIIITDYKGTDTNLIIPETINGIIVTEIGDRAFANKHLNSVTIPNSVNRIGIESFFDNPLKIITVGANVDIHLKSFPNNMVISYERHDRRAGTYTWNGRSWSVALDADVTTTSSKTNTDFEFSQNRQGTITITGYKGTDKNIVIPATINGIKVTHIGDRAFAYQSSGEIGIRIIFPGEVIPDPVFPNYKITSVTIPNSVISIGNNAFSNNLLANVTIPSSVISIGESAFSGNQLTNVTIPNSVTSLGNFAFSKNQLSSVTISNRIANIGNNVFSDNQLSSISIPNSVTNIGNEAFARNQLTSITFPNNVTRIGDGAFADNQINNVTIPNSVTRIGNEAFTEYNLNSITIGRNVNLNVNSFPKNFTALYERNVKRAGLYTWTGITWAVTYDPSLANTYAHSEDDFEFTQNLQGTITITKYNGIRTQVVIPATIEGIRVTHIGERAFAGGVDFQWSRDPGFSVSSDPPLEFTARTTGTIISVTIPNTVISIGDGAFSANQLASITIPNSVASIGKNAFSGNQLATVTIPNSVTSIGDSAFRNNKLTNVTISNRITIIESHVFSFNQLVSVIIPNNVTAIGDMAFYNNLLTRVNIPNSVTSIGNGAFEKNQLVSVNIPSSVSSIGYQAFTDNPLTSFTLGADVSFDVLVDQTKKPAELIIAFPHNFAVFYASQGKRAGRYTWNGRIWRVE